MTETIYSDVDKLKETFSLEKTKSIFPKDLADILIFEEDKANVLIRPRSLLGLEDFIRINDIVRNVGGKLVRTERRLFSDAKYNGKPVTLRTGNFILAKLWSRSQQLTGDEDCLGDKNDKRARFAYLFSRLTHEKSHLTD